MVLEIRRLNGLHRWAVDRNTYLNAAFDLDAQWVLYDPARREVRPVPAPRNSIRRTMNLMKPYNRTMESRLTRGSPNYQPVPVGDPPNEDELVELGLDLVGWAEYQVDIEYVRQQMAFWLQRSGNYVLFNLWDEDTPITDVHAPHECFYWPLTAVRETNCVLFGREVRISRAEALARYGDIGDQIPETSTDTYQGNLTRQLRDFAPGQHGWLKDEEVDGTFGIGQTDADEAVLLEAYIRPGGALMMPGLQEGTESVLVFKQGAYLVTTLSGYVLEFEKTNPYSTPRHPLPVVVGRHSQGPGFYAPAPCTPLRPIQMAINWAYSLYEMHMELAGKPVMLWPRQARAAWRRLQDVTTRVLRFSAGSKGEKPEYMDPPRFPDRLPELLNFLVQVWQDVSGVHEVSRGQLPAANLSGVAIQLLQDQDDTQVHFAIRDIEMALARTMEQHIGNAQRFTDGEQLLQVFGTERQVRMFQGTQLGAGLIMKVAPGSAIPKSPAALEAKARELWEAGAMIDQYGLPDHRRLLEVSGVANEDSLYFEEYQDKANARTEHEIILALTPDVALMALQYFQATGQLPEDFAPKFYDDHIIHEREHRLELKQLREKAMLASAPVNPLALQVLELHWQLTVPMMFAQRGGPGTGEEESTDSESGDESGSSSENRKSA